MLRVYFFHNYRKTSISLSYVTKLGRHHFPAPGKPHIYRLEVKLPRVFMAREIREIKHEVYGKRQTAKRQTSDRRSSFRKVNDKYTRIVQNNSRTYAGQT